MGKRSTILDLPSDLREALNARLVAGGFSGYAELAEWLNEQLDARELELRVSRSALHRHGQQFEARLERLRMATERARALAEGSKDEAGDLNEALIRLVQVENLEFLEELDSLDLPPEKRAHVLGKLNTTIARIVRASVGQKRWAREARAAIDERLRAIEAEITGDGQRRFDPDTLRRVREEIYGIYE